MLRLKMITVGAVLTLAAPAYAAPAHAGNAPKTRLVDCGAQSCLLVTGQRADVSQKVSINGHIVETTGVRKWRARVPVATVRGWSAPYARTVTVAVSDVSYDARLPVGMLGQPSDLAMLVVRVK